MEKVGRILVSDTRYYTGVPCIKGHIAERMRSSRRCVLCLKVDKKKWDKANRHHVDRVIRNSHFKRKYGITVHQYNRIYKRQEGLCLLCNQPEIALYGGKVRLLAVDHCHKTGKFRGLLCSACNRGLGSFKDDPDLIWKARKYLLGDYDKA